MKTYESLAKSLMDKISNDMGLVQSAFYRAVIQEGINKLSYEAGFAFHLPESQSLG